MASALDDALERGARSQRERDEGQTNLFDIMGDTDDQAPIHWPDVPEWRETLRLGYEKESLGFYITGHPLTRYENELHGLTNTNTELIKELPDKTSVRLGGVIVKVQPKMTKKGERMAFVTVEDLAGLVEVIVFPDAFKACRDYLEPDTTVLISGELTVDEKGAASTNKIKAKEIMLLETALEKMVRRVVFSLSATGLERSDLVRLKANIDSHPGQTPAEVKINVPGQGAAVVKLNSGVKAGRGLIRETGEALGENTVTFMYS